MEYTITITESERLALESIAVDVKEWIANAAKARAGVASSDIINKLIAHCNENNIQIANGLDAQIQQAYDLGVVKKLVDNIIIN
jgi:hypothetical protein